MCKHSDFDMRVNSYVQLDIRNGRSSVHMAVHMALKILMFSRLHTQLAI